MNSTTKWLVVICCCSLAHAATNTVLCYYSSWARNRKGPAQFGAADIPAGKCSHIVYAFIRPTAEGGIQEFDDDATIQQLLGLKAVQPNLKVLASVGGWAAGSANFSTIVSSWSTRGSFVEALSAFVDRHRLDGIDIDWEYPAQRGGATMDNVNFAVFLRELREKLGRDILITAAVGKQLSFIGPTYDVPCLNLYLDFISLMTYNYHSPQHGRRAGQNAPLYDPNQESHSADATIRSWIDAGASREKILMGLSFGGKSFKLSSPDLFGVGSTTSGPGNGGPYVRQAGFKMYLETCSELMEGGWTTVYDDTQECPYSYKGDQWVGYDNVQSIRAKTQYAVDNGLGGVMMWAIDHDDLREVCGTGSMPLLNAISSVINV